MTQYKNGSCWIIQDPKELWKKGTGHKVCVWFLLQLLFSNFFLQYLVSYAEDMCRNVCFHVKYYYCLILIKIWVCCQIFVKFPIIKFIQHFYSGFWVLMCRQTDRPYKANKYIFATSLRSRQWCLFKTNYLCFRSVKHYFLLDQGDFIVQFMDSCEAELSKNIDDIVPTRLESLLELALRTSAANGDPYKDDMRTELLPYDLMFQMFKILSIETDEEKGSSIQ